MLLLFKFVAYFPDEHLFAVSSHSPWYAYVANYLAVGKIPTHLSKGEKRKNIQQSSKYCWVNGHLFYTCPNLEIRICVREDEIFHILKAYHDEPCGDTLQTEGQDTKF